MATEQRLISLDDLMKFPIRINHYDKGHGNEHFVLGIESVLEYAEQLPTIEARPVVHGRWLLTAHEEQCNFRWNVTAECSECQHSKGEIYAGHFTGYPKHLAESMILIYAKEVKLDNYCPNCGAQMMDGGAVDD